MTQQIFSIFQVILGIAMIGLILLQTKGTGLGSTFGGELGFYRTKRGFEKVLFYATMVIAALFLISSVVGLLV